MPFALALNENSRNLSVLSFGTQTVVAAVPATDPPAPGAETRRNKGRKFFVTGLGRWSLQRPGLELAARAATPTASPTTSPGSSPAARARPPRSTAATIRRTRPQRRVLNWTGIFDEVHDFELNTRGNSGGVGAIVHRTGPPVAAGDRIIFDGARAGAPSSCPPPPRRRASTARPSR